MKKLSPAKKLNADELTFFCTQLSLILKSGVTLRDGIIMLMDDAHSPAATELLTKIVKVVENKKPFFDALASTGMFSEYFINMVRIGEMTGHLDSVFDGLAHYYQRESNLKGAIKGAIMHPLILLFMMSGVIAVLILKVLPIFKEVFMQLGSQINTTSNSAISFASSTGVFVLIIVSIVILFVICCFIMTRFNNSKKLLITLASKLPCFKRIFDRIGISRFSSAMSLMISSGVDTLESLELSKKVVKNSTVSAQIDDCSEKVNNHIPFPQAVSDSGIFPSLYSQMIKISYKSGSLDEVWRYISKKYDDEVSDSLNNVVSFIEPLLVGLLSIIIGVILVSVMLPLMGLMTSMS